jgi:hypothetical protein
VSSPIPHAAPYTDERQRFLADVEQLGATVEHHVHPLCGPDGEALATDVARLGAAPGEADLVVVVSSGLHGVEGHAGSGLQHLLCRSGRLGSLRSGTAVVLVHSLNPFGHAWERRVDHTNVDVNRNFLDDFADPPPNRLYAEVDHLLNPTDGDLDPADTAFMVELGEWMSRVGSLEAFAALSGGQYTHPEGVQFGGSRATWTRSTLEAIWARHLTGAQEAIALDIHTGLGPMGRLTVFQTADEAEVAAELGRRWFPEHLYRADREPELKVDHGLMGPGLDAWADSRLRTSTFVVEFGTHDVAQGVQAFRADNWLHHHGEPASPTGREIRQAMIDFFSVDDEPWRAGVATDGLAAIGTVLDDSSPHG